MNMKSTVIPTTTIEQLYDEYHQPLLRHLERLVHHRETAEDLCHETFIKALRHCDQRDVSLSARGWLYTIATNTAFDYLRRQRRVRRALTLADPAELPNEPAFAARLDEREMIRMALRRIPKHYRAPLLLHLYAGYELQTIATALGCNINTIKSRVHRARAQFRQIYLA
jgi:RNA polymerase sigma-70 factor, ECF subfamily